MSDTIYALSSGVGKAGIAVVRVSGREARNVLAALAGTLPEPRVAALRSIRKPDSRELLDRGIVLWFPGPASATGEDLAELHLHGSAAVLAALFGEFAAMRGVRAAEAGEFTRRAFANGRLDLVEAEGLADLLQAQTEMQRRQAMIQFGGQASSIYAAWRGELIRVLSRVEAAVDFVEEEEVARAALGDIATVARCLADNMTDVLRRSDGAAVLRDGIRVVLAGLPNTGKSSLLNAMAQREAAIVSSVPGTTRDVIEVHLDLGGFPVIVSDTAGLREQSEDPIEKIGMARARRELADADIIAWVSAPDVVGSDRLETGVAADVLVRNKADLLREGSGAPVDGTTFLVSTRSQEGLEAFLSGLTAMVSDRYGQMGSAIAVRRRHRDGIVESIRWLNESVRHDTDHLELAAEDLRKGALALGRVTGAIDVEDLLSAIFSEFCIGK